MPTPSTAATVAAPSSAPPINVSPEQLRKDYKANEVSADERYRGKALMVIGTVKAIKKDFRDAPYVQLQTASDWDNVIAYFDAESAGLLGKLAPGDRIKVLCVGNNVSMGDPQLKDCSLQ